MIKHLLLIQGEPANDPSLCGIKDDQCLNAIRAGNSEQRSVLCGLQLGNLTAAGNGKACVVDRFGAACCGRGDARVGNAVTDSDKYSDEPDNQHHAHHDHRYFKPSRRGDRLQLIGLRLLWCG